MNTDYKTEALQILLNEDCVVKRFYPLIPYKDILVKNLIQMGAKRKSDCMKLSDDALEIAFPAEAEMRALFRAFLTFYEPDAKKTKEIEKANLSSDEEAAFRELFCLPGVRSIRASLYYKAGFHSLKDIALSTPEEIIERTARTIQTEKLSSIVPMMKEAKTHIAVAKAFTDQL